MLVITRREYDLRHSGDEMDRAELIAALEFLAALCGDSAEITVDRAKPDMIALTIVTVDSP